MPSEQASGTPNSNPDTNASGTSFNIPTLPNGDIDLDKLPTPLAELTRRLLKETREANEEARKAKSSAKQQLDNLLAESGNHKTLAEQRAGEIAALEPYKTRAEALEAVIQKQNETRISSIPESMRSLVPSLPPEALADWLASNAALLQRTPPTLDAGKSSNISSAPQVNAELAAMAKKAGIPLENVQRTLNQEKANNA